MMFDKINTNKCSASYIMHELSKDLADKILKNSPILVTVQYPGAVDTNIIEGLKMITD